MDFTNLKTIKECGTPVYGDYDVTDYLKKGWVLIAVRIQRPAPDSKGAFKEELIYTLGHPSENP